MRLRVVSFNGGAYPYGYDANGNTTWMHNFNDPANVREQTITYNADNMPKQIEWVTFSGGSSMFWTVDFEYDGQSRRVKKTKSWGSDTFYIGDHFEIENGTEVKYIFAGNQRVAKVTAAGTHFFHKDHLGSSNVVTDYANGAAVETSEYLPFGQTREQTGTAISNYKFTDQELDPSTGLYNYDARLYDPVVGRFITADSIVPDWYNPQALNRYAYVLNNPLKYTDPNGHSAVTDIAIGVGWVAAIVEPTPAGEVIMAWLTAARAASVAVIIVDNMPAEPLSGEKKAEATIEDKEDEPLSKTKQKKKNKRDKKKEQSEPKDPKATEDKATKQKKKTYQKLKDDIEYQGDKKDQIDDLKGKVPGIDY